MPGKTPLSIACSARSLRPFRMLKELIVLSILYRLLLTVNGELGYNKLYIRFTIVDSYQQVISLNT